MSRTDLTGRVVAVTGGARGIGDATAQALAAAGARVVVGDLDGELAAIAAKAYDGLGLQLDVTSADSFARFLDAAEAEHGRIDALVNNAGIMVIGRMLETDLDKQLRQLDVNLRGVILGCHAVAPRLPSPGGRIVNIASLAGRIPTPGSAVYAATKAGVLALSEALDAELAPGGVRVSAVLPAFTATRLIDGTSPPALSKPIRPEQVAARVVALLGRHRATAVVPRRLAGSAAQWNLMPARTRAATRRALGLDSMFTDYDHAARADYDRDL